MAQASTASSAALAVSVPEVRLVKLSRRLSRRLMEENAIGGLERGWLVHGSGSLEFMFGVYGWS